MITLNNENNYPVAVAPKTAAGNLAKVDGVPVWTTSDPDVFTLNVADDGLSALLVTGDTGSEIKTAKLKVTADADLGDGVRTITLEADVVVGPAEAESIAFTLGDPQPK